MTDAESPLRDRMIFNVGARRSGTYWLQRIVTAHPAVSSVPSETALFSHGIAPLFERFQHGARSSPQVGAVYVEREPVIEATRRLCDAVFAGHLEPGSRYLAERTPQHVLHLDLIAELYPDARVVHIIRDGRDVARSLVAQPWGPDTIADAAEEWRRSIEAARSAALSPDRYREVRYEDLEADPETTIAALFEWLGLDAGEPVLSRVLAEAQREGNVDRFGAPGVGGGKWRTSLDARDLAELDRVAGGLLEELGYQRLPAAESQPKATAGSARAATSRPGIRARLGDLRRRRGPRRRPALLPPLQQLADEAVEALVTRHVEALGPLLDPGAVVRVISGAGVEEARGTEGAELLRRTVTQDQALEGRQVRGDTYLGGSTIAYVLSFERGGVHLGDRVVLVTARDRSVTEIVLYLMPLGKG